MSTSTPVRAELRARMAVHVLRRNVGAGNGYERLWLAVLERAVLDLFAPRVRRKLDGGGHTPWAIPYVRRSARAFFVGDRLADVCNMIDLDAVYVREVVLAAMWQRRLPAGVRFDLDRRRQPGVRQLKDREVRPAR